VSHAEPLVDSEVFGPTIQGEGSSAGRRCGFVRLGRCSLACSWCDSKYTWDWDHYDPAAELAERSPGEVLGQLDGMRVDMVVVTGGEPLLQQRALAPLLEGIKARGWRVEVETSGTIVSQLREGLVDQFNVSPKLANSGNAPDRRYRPDVLRSFAAAGNAIFKFVVAHDGELDEVAAIVDACDLAPVWVMPEGTTANEVADRTAALAPAVVARGWNLTTRLHILVWGDRRGF
jgi:7-cyano-7-deazaguanosine (preQ0) biosynthesis protein QueE